MSGESSIRAADRPALDEWLVTDGLGGYAMGTLAGVPTRSYHGLLVAALDPPVGRTVLVAGLLETVTFEDGREIRLHALAQGEGPEAAAAALSVMVPWQVEQDGSMVVWTYDLGSGLRLERRIWMADGAPTTYVRYQLHGGRARLRLEPLETARDHHTVGRVEDGQPAGPLRILAPGAAIESVGRWIRDIHLAEETARGLVDRTDAWIGRSVDVALEPDRPSTLILTASASEPMPPEAALAEARTRDRFLLAKADAAEAPATVQRLVLAADPFIVRREIAGLEDGRTIIAGYPWFNDWGRDTMIALPGLCLATGRYAEAATILRTFARSVRDGLIPNDFQDGGEPAYHTIDASLWFVEALRAYEAATGNAGLREELLPTMRDIIEAHIAGTRFGIGMDPADGLLRGGAEGVQLTWMDAKVDDWVVTPRRGKPVEIQALWINALLDVADWTGEARYATLAVRAEAAFRARFWRPDLGYLADVVDGPDGDETALRPNQLLALSLPHPLVDGDVARSVLAHVRGTLLVPLALRSLAPDDPAYRPRYQGDRYERDGAYHQGTAWTWLIGPYADAVARFEGGAEAAFAAVAAISEHLEVEGLGSVSEILEPEAPFAGRGCPFQAWGVAEVLRVLRRYGGD